MIVYSKQNCPNCDKLKNYLKANSIDFEEIDITKNDEAKNHIINNGFLALPVVDLGGELVVGTSLIK